MASDFSGWDDAADLDGHDSDDDITMDDFAVYSWRCGCGKVEDGVMRKGRAQCDALAHRAQRADHHVSLYKRDLPR